METTTTLPTPLLPPQPDRVRAARIAAVRNSLSVANFVLTSSPTNSVRATEPLPFSSSFPTQTFSPRAHRPGNTPVTLKSAADGEPERCRRLEIVQTARNIEHAAQLSLNIKPLIGRQRPGIKAAIKWKSGGTGRKSIIDTRRLADLGRVDERILRNELFPQTMNVVRVVDPERSL